MTSTFSTWFSRYDSVSSDLTEPNQWQAHARSKSGGAFAELCKRQEYMHDDDEYFGSVHTCHDYSDAESLCSSLHPYSSEDGGPTPPSDSTVFSPAFKSAANTPLPQDYRFPDVKDQLPALGVPPLSVPPTIDMTEPVTPGTFFNGLQDSTLSLRNSIVPTLRVNGQDPALPTKQRNINLTSKASPFVKVWIYRTRHPVVKSSAQMYVKMPAYVIPELLDLGMQPSPRS